ncbi:hypothetical protein FH972_002353 [Carpinus fangiana]|uniref:Uncharacterized protein n=1 Tax=Carpinus fangiana TaxID=176857 RepID=A0A5N6QGH0_9ROSI|nr:hypothetical protein FH972_002353 [Carpinus fangiana]
MDSSSHPSYAATHARDTGDFGSYINDGLGSVEFCLEDVCDLAPALSQATLLDLECVLRIEWNYSFSPGVP